MKSANKYIDGKGILVGEFDEEDLKVKRDKKEVEKAKEEFDLKYTNAEFIYKGKEISGLRIYVCTVEDFKI